MTGTSEAVENYAKAIYSLARQGDGTVATNALAERLGVTATAYPCGESFEAVREARAKGLPIYGETLHQYLMYTSEDYRRPNGQIYHTYPSLKSADDRDAMRATGRVFTQK